MKLGHIYLSVLFLSSTSLYLQAQVVVPAQTTPVADQAAPSSLQAIRDAADPSSAIDAYAKATAADRDNLSVQKAYVEKMVGFGLPEMAETQAQEVTRSDPENGLAWAVVAYMNAKRHLTPAALTAIAAAVRRAPQDSFVVRTAAELIAWYDVRADKSQIPAAVKDSVEVTRKELASQQAYREAFDKAKESYTARAADDAQQAAAGQQPPTTPNTPTTDRSVDQGLTEQQPAPAGGYTAPPPPIISDTYYSPPVYTDPYAYGAYPSYGYSPSYWYPSGGYGDWWWPSFSLSFWYGSGWGHNRYYHHDDGHGHGGHDGKGGHDWNSHYSDYKGGGEGHGGRGGGNGRDSNYPAANRAGSRAGPTQRNIAGSPRDSHYASGTIATPRSSTLARRSDVRDRPAIAARTAAPREAIARPSVSPTVRSSIGKSAAPRISSSSPPAISTIRTPSPSASAIRRSAPSISAQAQKHSKCSKDFELIEIRSELLGLCTIFRAKLCPQRAVSVHPQRTVRVDSQRAVSVDSQRTVRVDSQRAGPGSVRAVFVPFVVRLIGRRPLRPAVMLP